MFEVYVTDLAKYNNGILEGEWFSLPADEESIEELKSRFGEETFITDFECDKMNNLELYEIDSIDELNELGEKLDALDEWDLEKVDALLEYGETLECAISIINDVYFWSNMTLEEVAYDIANEVFNIAEPARDYFNYSKFAEDLSYENFAETSLGTLEWY